MRHKIAVVPLAGNADTGGGLGAWQNPEGAAVIIDRVEVYVSTVATAACTADVGTTATNATTSSDNLLDGLDVHSAVDVYDNLKNPGSNGKASQLLASGKWVTFSRATGASAGLVGTAYIFYHLTA